ncbi:MAG: DNA repair protein RadC [Gammaproteobacteria bacterium]|nr:DNA repair protein RadC [Gammaproteobacteria bacterium]
MTIKNLPENERPREKLIKFGANHLSDIELLAIFLRTGIKGLTAIDLARNLLQHFGGLRQLLKADAKTFCEVKGLGLAKYSQLQACLELSSRFFEQTLQQTTVFNSVDITKRYLANKIRDKEHEVFTCLYLNNQHFLIHAEELFRGTIDSASVHPREIVKNALSYNAAALIIAHNHPSGIAEPSQSDKIITEKIKSALELVDIRLLDHFIVGNSQITSLAEQGFL